MVHNLKLPIVYIWNFSFHIFGQWLTAVTETEETETVDKWGVGVGTNVHLSRLAALVEKKILS